MCLSCRVACFFFFYFFYFLFFYLFFYFLFFIYLFIYFCQSPSSPPLSLCVSLSTYLSLSLSQSRCLSLSRCIKKEKEKKGEKGKKIIYFFGSVWRHFWPACAYAWARMVRSGLLLLTRSRWMLYVAMYPVFLLVLANHRRRVAGCLANKLHCLLYSFWFFTN